VFCLKTRALVPDVLRLDDELHVFSGHHLLPGQDGIPLFLGHHLQQQQTMQSPSNPPNRRDANGLKMGNQISDFSRANIIQENPTTNHNQKKITASFK
jgi:hypothetical protein